MTDHFVFLDEDNSPSCGIVMPIASMGDYPDSHWIDVQNIIKESVRNAGYEARLVSESADATVIIKSIVQNIYNDEIVICDVSGMNPNVMFELGMRLAFDKPVVIIKDEVTRFSFDISTIEHLVYPKSLRYQAIQQFKIKLADKIKATVSASKQDGYSSFLSNFGSFTVANLKDTTLNESEALERILSKLEKFDGRLATLESVNDSDVELLNHFNKVNSRPVKEYKPLMKITADSNFNNTKFESLSNTLNALYGDEVRLILSGNAETSDLTLSIFSTLEHSPRHMNRIKTLIHRIMSEESEGQSV